MRLWLRAHLSYSNVVATMCLALLLGGTAVALEGAQTSATATKVYACAKKRGGAMRLAKARTKCKRTEKKVSWAKAAGGEPSGAIGFYAASSCPSGYSVYEEARGRYLVGLPNGGQLAAAVGTALSPEENRPVGKHDHTITDPGHGHTLGSRQTINTGNVASHTAQGNASTVANDQLPTSTDTTGITVNPAGAVDGTNAPYLELLVCKKD
ncbi:MAG TPA: hypothetical protein VF072_06370 [Thermoleophilaceae bacterium]